MKIENDDQPRRWGTGGGLSRSVKEFLSHCAVKGSISPGRFGCCHGEDQARKMTANFINRAFGLVSLRGVARVRHEALTAVSHGLKAARCWPLDLGGYAGGQERVGLDWRPGSGRVHLPSASNGVV